MVLLFFINGAGATGTYIDLLHADEYTVFFFFLNQFIAR